MQVLTISEVKKAAREYYAAGKLTAQHPDPDKRECVNGGAGDYRCAVAAAFSHETLNAHPTGSVSILNRRGAIRCGYDLMPIVDIQIAHDDWACTSREVGIDHPFTKIAHDRFLALIQD